MTNFQTDLAINLTPAFLFDVKIISELKFSIRTTAESLMKSFLKIQSPRLDLLNLTVLGTYFKMPTFCSRI